MEKILVVDDEKGLVDVISDILLEEGYEVKGTTSPVEAIKLINEKEFDLVITDLRMPSVDGIEVTNAAKKRSENTEVILITGFGSLESAIKALKKGVYDYILKPFNIADVSNAVNRVIEKQRLARLNQELRAKIEKNLNDITTLYEISKVISSANDLGKILNFTSETIHESVEIEMFSIMLYNKENNRFEIERAVGLNENTKKDFSFEINKGIIGGSLKDKDIIFVKDFKKDEDYIKYIDKEDRKRFASFVIIPFVVGDEIFGLITVHSIKKNNAEDMDKLNLLSIISTQISPLIKLFLYRKEQEMIFDDPLFRVKKQMESIVDKAVIYKGGLIFVIFKLYLKRFGEKAYKILDIHQKIFKKLKDNVSIIDSVIVLGLDSFVVILQGRAQVEAEIFTMNIKRELENDILLRDSGFLLDHGYAAFPIDGESAEELIGKAQNNLWKSFKSI